MHCSRAPYAIRIQLLLDCVQVHTVLNGLMRYYGYDAKRPCGLDMYNLFKKVKQLNILTELDTVELQIAKRMSSEECGDCKDFSYYYLFEGVDKKI